MWSLKKKNKSSDGFLQYKIYSSAGEAVGAKAIGSTLASNSTSEGNIKCSTGLKVDGRHFGSLIVDGMETAVCWVYPSATVVGDVIAPCVYVEGRIDGDIYADMVVVLDSGLVEGDVHAVGVTKKGRGEVRGRTLNNAPGAFKLVGSKIQIGGV